MELEAAVDRVSGTLSETLDGGGSVESAYVELAARHPESLRTLLGGLAADPRADPATAELARGGLAAVFSVVLSADGDPAHAADLLGRGLLVAALASTAVAAHADEDPGLADLARRLGLGPG